jgi:large subunit ribosomal protein L18
MSTQNKNTSRLRRAGKTRHAIKRLEVNRLCVHRTSKHIYAQVISPVEGKVLAYVSSLDAALKESNKYTGNIEAAKIVGSLIAKKCADAGIKKVAFDRSGYRYHGRVKALAEAAREGGVEF